MFSNEYDKMGAHVDEGLTVENHLATYYPNNPCSFIHLFLATSIHMCASFSPDVTSVQMLVTYRHLYVKKR